MAEERDATLLKIAGYFNEASNLRSEYDSRMARNMKIMKGIPIEDKTTRSEIRQRNKIYFRKVWATIWRLTAAFYGTFLRDAEPFRVEGRDVMGDEPKANLLQFMTKYRLDKMSRARSLFLKHVWAFQNIGSLGWCVGKLCWKYNEEMDIDEPEYIVWPNEQAYLDFASETKDKMRFVIFESFLTKDELEESGYENIEEAKPESIPTNEVRSIRYSGTKDPLQNPGPKEYPEGGRYSENGKDNKVGTRYRVWECFYKEKGRMKFCVTNGEDRYFKKPIDSPYGNGFDMLILGLCLTEPHKIVGEGFPEPLEGPQESYNYNLNMRKDNVALALNKPTYVSRYNNVDLNALMNRGPRKAVLMDDVSGIKESEIQDVTASSYTEAQADDMMMQEMSGITAGHQGMSDVDTATQANINMAQGSAKIDLYIAIVGETYMRDFYYCLARQIQKFETDENVFRVANSQVGLENPYDLDFDADVIVNAGLGNASRQEKIRQTLLVMDRALMANQAAAGLLQTGAIPPEGIRMIDTTKIFEDIMPDLGKKDLARYFITIPPPPTPGQRIAGNGPMAGGMTPQVGGGEIMPQNNFQQGALGGF